MKKEERIIEVPVPTSCTIPHLELMEVPTIRGDELSVKELAMLYLETRRNLEKCNIQSERFNNSFGTEVVK